MAIPANHSAVTVKEYLESEARAVVRHEYVDGLLFAMSGVTPRHNIIALNIYSTIRAHIGESHCRAYVSDVKVRIESINSFYYPDVMVACGRDNNKAAYVTAPVLIVEVLSRSTAAIDRREKVIAYRQIESLKEYVIVHQRKKLVELHCKDEQGRWIYTKFTESAELTLESMPAGPLKLSLAAIYEDVTDLDDLSWTGKNDLNVREQILDYGYLATEDTDEEDSLDW